VRVSTAVEWRGRAKLRDGREPPAVNAASRDRRRVFGKSAAFTCAYLLAIWAVHAQIVIRSIAPSILPLATAFVIVQSGAIGLLAAALIGRTVAAEVLERRTRRFQPPILNGFAEHAAGADRSPQLRRWYDRHPAQLERCLAQLLPTVSGAGRDRLSQLAVDLRPHAVVLSERAIPDCLQSGDRDRVLTALEIIEAWGRALPLPHALALVRSADPVIRVGALRVLPLATDGADLLPEIVNR